MKQINILTLKDIEKKINDKLEKRLQKIEMDIKRLKIKQNDLDTILRRKLK